MVWPSWVWVWKVLCVVTVTWSFWYFVILALLERGLLCAGFLLWGGSLLGWVHFGVFMVLGGVGYA